MTYNPAIPNANDIISQSQSQIKTNFGQADLIFDINHVTFDDPTSADRGKHRKVDFVRQSVDPGSAATQLTLYEKLSGTSSDLFFQRDNVAAVTQLTGGGITTAAWCQFNGATVGTNPPTEGYNVTSVTRNSAGNYTLNFTRNFATTNYCVQIQLMGNVSSIITPVTRNVNSFSFVSSGLANITDVNVVIFGTLA